MRSETAKRPPMRPGWPLLGNVHELLRDPSLVLADSYERLGPVFRLRVLWKTFNVIGGTAALDFMRQHLDETMLSRRDFFGPIEKQFGGADLTLAQSGKRHTRLRAPLAVAFSRQAASPFVPGMVDVVRQHVREWKSDTIRPAVSELTRMAFDAYCFALFGDAAALPFRDSLLVTEYGMAVGGQLRPQWIFLLPWYRAAHRRAFDAMWGQVRARRGAAGGQTPGILDILLHAQDADGAALTEDEAVTYAAYGVAAACAYESRLIAFMLYEILKSPELQVRLRQEADEVFSRGLRDSGDARGLHLLNSVYQEALRRHAISPGMPFYAKQDFTFAGFQFRRGEIVVVSPVPLAYSACPFQRARSFDPERFLGPDGKELQSAFYPFGLANRTCVATGLIKIIALVMMATILHERQLGLHPSDYQLRQAVRPLPSPDGRFRFCVAERAPSTIEAVATSPPVETEVLASYLGSDEPEVVAALREATPRAFASGEIIIRQNAAADAFYLLTRGSVNVTRRRGNDVVRLAELAAGDFFGETGLLQDAPCNATVTAGTAGAEALVLGRGAFLCIVSSSDLVAAEIAGLVRRRLAETLLRETVSRLGTDAIDPMLREFTTRTCSPGEVIIREGDPAEHFFIVKTGRVRVIRERATAVVTLANLIAGDIFGEIGLLSGAPRSATVVASEDVQGQTAVWVTDHEGFRKLLSAAAQRHGELGEALLSRLEQKAS